MKAILIFLILCMPFQLFALEKSWGKGVVQCSSDSKFSIDIFDAPCGHPIGSLNYEEARAMTQKSGFVWIGASGISLALPDNILLETGYEVSSLIVHAEQNGFVKVLRSDMDEEFWLSIDELTDAGFSYQPWIDFMTQNGITFFTVDYGMNCRVEPSANASKLLTVKGDEFEIEPTGEVKGNWAAVAVSEYSSTYCEEPHDLIKTYRGWMKLVDDEGFPNVWFYTRGC